MADEILLTICLHRVLYSVYTVPKMLR